MPPRPLVLAFDTSAAHCAAALLCGDKILSHRVEEMSKGQAERLFPMLEEVLQQTGHQWRDLNAIGVGTGPGNFTGIRISVSAARGLALSLGIPAIGISALQAQIEGTRADVAVSVLDARQSKYYLQVFGTGEGSAPILCDLKSLPIIPALAKPVVIGHDAAQIADVFVGRVADAVHPIAIATALIAQRRISNAPARPVPLYVRSADAAPPRNPAPVILS